MGKVVGSLNKDRKMKVKEKRSGGYLTEVWQAL